MQARTERCLGVIAAITLTIAAFTVPPIAPQLTSYVKRELNSQTTVTRTFKHRGDGHMKLARLDKHF
ncbi:hypothetical protein ACFOLL_07495 [Falsochrobactrum ovis]|uniref:Uncharacterized protein n=1 Tax=Falsochrobactrum ovis TaxID=1293442 RepID=A0A364JZ24_9HYPH|nr:hypothetical protein [Falsochrobactrum ovis]RAK33966.1 hypothetical protein C7374_101293 [Falsochrobactrum ovis]